MSLRSRILVIVVSAFQFAAICLAISSIAEQGDRLFEFFFNRSIVQFLILYVFALSTTLLGHRFFGYLRDRLQLHAAKKNEDNWRDRAGAITGQINAVRKRFTEYGGSAALSCVVRIGQEEKDKLRKAYEVINFLILVLPALGLFGTMLGLSNSLFTAFSHGAAGPEAVQKFVGALSTALDTTVLALACAMLVGGCGWLLNRLEDGLSDQKTGLVRSLFSLDEFPPERHVGKNGEISSSHSPIAMDEFRSELRALTAEIVAETKSKFEKFLLDTAVSHYLNLDRAVRGALSKQREREEAMVEKVASRIAERLGESIAHVGKLIEKHNGRSTKDFVSKISRLEKALRKRTPDEVIIRYEHDGNS